MLAIARVPLAAPPDWGVKVTLKVVLWPAASVTGRVRPVRLKPAPEDWPGDGDAGATGVGQRFRDGLRRASCTVPKFRLEGAEVRAPAVTALAASGLRACHSTHRWRTTASAGRATRLRIESYAEGRALACGQGHRQVHTADCETGPGDAGLRHGHAGAAGVGEGGRQSLPLTHLHASEAKVGRVRDEGAGGGCDRRHRHADNRVRSVGGDCDAAAGTTLRLRCKSYGEAFALACGESQGEGEPAHPEALAGHTGLPYGQIRRCRS